MIKIQYEINEGDFRENGTVEKIINLIFRTLGHRLGLDDVKALTSS